MGRHHKYKQLNVLKALKSLDNLSLREASKRFGVSIMSLRYAKKKSDTAHSELDKISNLPDISRNKEEIKKLTRLFHLSLQVLQEKLSAARAKDLAIVASILFDKRNLMLTKISPTEKVDFPDMSKKTKILIEQYFYGKKNKTGSHKKRKNVTPVKDIVEQEPITSVSKESP